VIEITDDPDYEFLYQTLEDAVEGSPPMAGKDDIDGDKALRVLGERGVTIRQAGRAIDDPEELADVLEWFTGSADQGFDGLRQLVQSGYTVTRSP